MTLIITKSQNKKLTALYGIRIVIPEQPYKMLSALNMICRLFYFTENAVNLSCMFSVIFGS